MNKPSVHLIGKRRRKHVSKTKSKSKSISKNQSTDKGKNKGKSKSKQGQGKIEGTSESQSARCGSGMILDFRGFDSSRILFSRGGIPMSIGNSPEIMSQQILTGMILVGQYA